MKIVLADSLIKKIVPPTNIFKSDYQLVNFTHMTNVLTKMTVSERQRLASIPRSRCAKCKSRQSYLNPLAKCWECGEKFCFDHFWRGLFKQGIKQTDELRNVCDGCREKFGYEELANIQARNSEK